MEATSHDIAIVGAGLSGSALAIQLARRMPKDARIVLIGRPDETGRGLAYRDGNPDLLLNVPAERLSIDPDDPGAFVRWLAENSARHPPGSFACRADYGRYVHGALMAAIAAAAGRVELVEGTVAAITPATDAFDIRLASGGRFRAARVALCLGNPPPQFRIADRAIEPAAHGRMIADPWNDPRMQRIAADDRVLLVGAGLTMVDQILTLRRNGHAAAIVAVSRHGRLPATHAASASAPVRLELAEAKGRLLAVFRMVAKAARAAEAAGEDWRAIIDGLRPATQEIWQAFTIAEQRRFLRHVESYWAVVRHRMAPAIADRVAEVRSGGTVEVAAGRVVAVRAAGEFVTAAIRDRRTRLVRIRPFEWIVNCTGPGRFPSLAANPAVAGLVAAGLARPDPLAVGLDVDADCRVVSRTGQTSTRLFAVGPITAGRFWESTAVAEIRQQASALAARLAGGADHREIAAAPVAIRPPGAVRRPSSPR
ncbi:MAG: FAD/NAD(P)-binding protein [Bauldia sp.]